MTARSAERCATLSPELALVDAELARSARERVEPPSLSHGDPPFGRPRTGAGEGLRVVPASGRSRRRALREKWARRSGPRVIAVVAATACIASVASAESSFGDVSAVTPAERPPTAAVAGEQVGSGRLDRRSTPRASAGRADAEAADAAADSVRTGPAPHVTTLRWRPVAGAVSYHVKLLRGEQVVLARTTRRPAIAVPSEWKERGATVRLLPGSYRWFAWAVVDGRWTPSPIVRSTLDWP